MTITELNPKGNFDSWDASKLKEINKGEFSDAVGEALFENAEIILWEIVLEPFERLAFRCHTNNYSCTYFASGLLLSRNLNGRIILARVERGDHFYWECRGKEIIQDIENIGETTMKIAVVEEKVKIAEKNKT